MAHQHLYDAAITTIRNEHLLGGRSAKLRRFCDFNGIEPSGEFLHALAGKTLFEKIRRKELQSEWDNPVWPADRAFTRRSIAGSYNDEMPPDVLAAFVQRADPSFKVRLLITGLDRGCQPISLLQRRVVGTIVRHRSRKERMEFGVVGANHAAYRRSSSCQSDESFFD